MSAEFREFAKIARLSRECVITEKIDGTNGCIYISDEPDYGQAYTFLVGSRSKWISPEDDNHGFARWAYANKEDLLRLGPGYHYGEWWGLGIQRGYGLKEKRFSLFNVSRWGDGPDCSSLVRPACCSVVPVLYQGLFDSVAVDRIIDGLRVTGSHAAPGFMKPEGVVIYHVQGRLLFKKTLERDEQPKGRGE